MIIILNYSIFIINFKFQKITSRGHLASANNSSTYTGPSRGWIHLHHRLRAGCPNQGYSSKCNELGKNYNNIYCGNSCTDGVCCGSTKTCSENGFNGNLCAGGINAYQAENFGNSQEQCCLGTDTDTGTGDTGTGTGGTGEFTGGFN